MIEEKEKAVVVALKGDNATLKVIKKPACSGCKACFFGKNENSANIKAKNTVNAHVGDDVLFIVHKDNSLIASILVYTIPIICMIGGICLSVVLWKKEIFMVLSALVGLLLGFFFLFLLDKWIAKTKNFTVKIVEIVQKEYQEDTKTKMDSNIKQI